MGLTLKNKAVFEWSDGISNTTISLSPEDDLETIITKLRTVVELVRPKGATKEELAARGVPFPEALFAGRAKRERDAKREQAKPGLEMPPSVNAGGWHSAPETPERWQGKVEMIPQEDS